MKDNFHHTVNINKQPHSKNYQHNVITQRSLTFQPNIYKHQILLSLQIKLNLNNETFI